MTDTTHRPRLMTRPRIGVLLPNFDAVGSGQPLPIVPAARLAEELGFGAAWVGDHLACPAPGLDAPSCLAAAAAVTENIRLGLSVMLLGLRAPAWAAKILATIDHLSSGRLVLGVGVGGEFPAEFEAAGVPVRQRGARLDDALQVIRDLLTGQPVHYEGRTMTVTAPSLQPAMATPPPIYVGGRGEAALHRAARHGDMWLPMWLTPDRVAERSAQLADLAEREGRPAPGTALLIGVHIDDDRARARAEAELHIRGQYRMGLEKIEHWTLLDSVDGAVEQLDAYSQAGVEEFVFMPLGREPLTQYERLAEVRRRFETAWTTSGASARGS
ncbi:MAG TPA: LLM class flavin-dependent oxidoreductase [Solirubrobacteraceae bacterium]|jgi:probable F420-dependent oxidoreductase|nr:LLM class flavin-dependent oxidoreductase [Solirubrobacteraceae bacterium]